MERSLACLLLVATVIILGSWAPAVAQQNIVRNGSFEVDTDGNGIPDFWDGRKLSPEDKRVEGGFDGQFSFRMIGEQGLRKTIRQRGHSNLPSGTRFVFSAYSKTEGGTPEGGLYGYKAEITFQDDSKEAVLLRFGFSQDWQRSEREFTLPKPMKRISYTLIYANQTGQAWFDLVRAEIHRP